MDSRHLRTWRSVATATLVSPLAVLPSTVVVMLLVDLFHAITTVLGVPGAHPAVLFSRPAGLLGGALLVGSIGSLVALPLVLLWAPPTMLLLERVGHTTAGYFALSGSVAGLLTALLASSPALGLLFVPHGTVAALTFRALVYRGEPDVGSILPR